MTISDRLSFQREQNPDFSLTGVELSRRIYVVACSDPLGGDKETSRTKPPRFLGFKLKRGRICVERAKAW